MFTARNVHVQELPFLSDRQLLQMWRAVNDLLEQCVLTIHSRSTTINATVICGSRSIWPTKYHTIAALHIALNSIDINLQPPADKFGSSVHPEYGIP